MRKMEKDSNDRSNPIPLRMINDSNDGKTGARILAGWEFGMEANQKSGIINGDFKERKPDKYRKCNNLRPLEKSYDDIEARRYDVNGAEAELSKDDTHEGDEKTSNVDGRESEKKYKGHEYFSSSRNFCDDGRTCSENKGFDEGAKGKRVYVNKQEKGKKKGKQKVITDFTFLRSDSAEGGKKLDDEIIHEGPLVSAKDKKKHMNKKERNQEIINYTNLFDVCNWDTDNEHDKKRKRAHHSLKLEQDDGTSWKKANEAPDKETKGISGDGADEASRKLKNKKKNREKDGAVVASCAEFPLEMDTRNGKDDQRNVTTTNNAVKSKFDIKRQNIGKGGSINGSNLKLRTDTEKDKKKVKFSSAVEFPTAHHSHEEFGSDNYSWGKRFTREEDELIRKSTMDYIERRNLGEQGLHMVLNCSQYQKLVRNCWKDISAALPWRHHSTVYLRGHRLFKRSNESKWEPEQIELLKRYYAEHGTKWCKFAEILGKDRKQIKDTWRRIRLPNRKRGKWCQAEFQDLFDLVNLDLRMKMYKDKISSHKVLKDNISWQAISNKLSTRAPDVCCLKWYGQLASSMVREGHWSDLDDYRMVDVLHKTDACCIEDVDWDNLLDNRDQLVETGV